MTRYDPKSGLWLAEQPRLCSLFPAVHGIAGAAGGAPYVANGVRFDGSNDWLIHEAELTGASDSPLITMSFWIKRATTGDMRFHTNDEGTLVKITSIGNFQYTFRGGGGQRVKVNGNVSFTDTTSWHHLLMCGDAEDITKIHLFFDDVEVSSSESASSGNIDLIGVVEHSLGATGAGGNKLNGCLADMWIGYGQYLDFTVTANRRKFASVAGSPVDLGSDGSIPTGVAPILFFTGPTSTWHTNAGTGGGFTENGALTDCGTDP